MSRCKQRGASWLAKGVAALLVAVLACTAFAQEGRAVTSFTDVNSGTGHYEDILWLADNKISTGYPDKTFRPMEVVYRQDMAAFLYRLADSPDYEPTPQDERAFKDVSPSTPHYKEILWLASTGISKGYPDKTFRPMEVVYRQDMAAFLNRLATYMKDEEAEGWQPDGASPFKDVDASTAHAREIFWLAAKKISTGYSDGTFRGMVAVYRQDMAAFLHRLSKHIDEQVKPTPPTNENVQHKVTDGFSYYYVPQDSGLTYGDVVYGSGDNRVFFAGWGAYIESTTNKDATLTIPQQIEGAPVRDVSISKGGMPDSVKTVDFQAANEITAIDLEYCPASTILASNLPEMTEFMLTASRNVTSIEISNCDILQAAWIFDTSITSLDFGNASLLNTLVCEYGKLQNLDVSGYPALKTLGCADNALTSLDVSHNAALTSLECQKNKISALNVSSNPGLETLNCANNDIQALDISHNKNLTNLQCDENLIADPAALSAWLEQPGHSGKVMPQKNTPKPELSVQSKNGMSYIIVPQNSRYDYGEAIGKRPDGTNVYFNGPGAYIIQVTSAPDTFVVPAEIDGAPVIDFTIYTANGGASPSSISFANASKIEYIGIYDTPVTSISLKGLSRLRTFTAASTNLKQVDLSDCAELLSLNLVMNPIKSVNLNTCPELQYLTVSNNDLESLDISSLKKLVRVDCSNNLIKDTSAIDAWGKQPGHEAITQPQKNTPKKPLQVKTLNGFKYALVTEESGYTWGDKLPVNGNWTQMPPYFNGYGAYILDYTETGNIALPATIEGKPVVYAQLSGPEGAAKTEKVSINATQANKLRELYVSNRSVQAIDFTGCTELFQVFAMQCGIENIELTGCSSLNNLVLWGNKLKSLDLTGLGRLEMLDVEFNDLTSLDITPCTSLNKLTCDHNWIKDTSALEAWLAQPGHSGEVNPQKTPGVHD